MASLSELYSSFDALKILGLDVQELQEKIEQKENEVLFSAVVDFLKIGCRNKNGCNSVNSELHPFSAIYSDFDCN